MRRVAVVALVMATAAIIGQVIYTRLIATGFPQSAHVKLEASCALVILVVGLVSGAFLASWREVTLVSLLVAVSFSTFATLEIVATIPAATHLFLFWTVTTVYWTAWGFLALAAGRLIRLDIQRLRGPSPD
jgi:hypothetical protein